LKKSSSILIATPNTRSLNLAGLVNQKLSGFKVITIENPNDLKALDLEVIRPEWIFFPFWSWIIPKEIFSRYRCVVFHMTDLPYGRGGSPLQNLILRGHRQTMLSAIECVAELDAGPVYVKSPLGLEGTAEEILSRCSVLIGDLIIELVTKNPGSKPQIGEVTIFERRKPSQGDISLLSSLDAIYDYIRMLDADDYPSAFLDTEHFQLDFKEAILEEEYIDAKVRIRMRPNA
jgi:methionyl-tRNA formyltransferase